MSGAPRPRGALARLLDPRHEAWVVAGLCLLALLARIGYVVTLEPRLYWYDGEQYSRLASGLVEHGAYLDARGRPSAFWPPGYPFLMAGVWALFGVNVVALRIVQALIGAGTVALVQRLARRALDYPGSLLAALATALYPLFIYATGTPFPVTLLIGLQAAVVLLVLVAVERGSTRAAAGAGLLAGWASLTSGSAFPPALLFAGWMAWAAAAGGRAFAGGLRLAAVFLVVLALVLGAWTVRNQRALGHPVLVSLNGGYNLWLGNYPEVDAATGSRMDLPGMTQEADSIWYGLGSEYLQNRAFERRAMQHIVEDPARFLRVTAGKALNLWALYAQPMTKDRPRLGIEKLASLLSYGVLLPFALMWLVRSSARSRTAMLVLLLFLVYTAVHAVYLSKVRYRLPLDPFVIIYGVGGLLAAGRALRPSRTRGGAAGIDARRR